MFLIGLSRLLKTVSHRKNDGCIFSMFLLSNQDDSIKWIDNCNLFKMYLNEVASCNIHKKSYLGDFSPLLKKWKIDKF